MKNQKTIHQKILHIDLDAFFCAVEEKLDSTLKGKPFAVGGSPEGRGVVTSCSYAARKFGIRSAMPMKQALRIYPHLIVVRSHYMEYSHASHQVMEILKNLTPLFEQISIDEAFIDVTDLPQTAIEIANTLQKRIKEELSLPCSIGIAGNKLMAKIATNQGKSSNNKSGSPPMAICEVPPGREIEFLSPLPVREMWGIGPKAATHLERIGIRTIGEIAKTPIEILVKHFGKFGYSLAERARGIDDRSVVENGEAKSVSNEITFIKDIQDETYLVNTIRDLSVKVASRLRKMDLCGFTVRLKIRWPDFKTYTRQITLAQPTNQDSVIFNAASKLFYEIWKKGFMVRLLGVGVSQLTNQFQQLSLLDHAYTREKQLLEAVDDLHHRFGKDIIRRGLRDKNDRSWKE